MYSRPPGHLIPTRMLHSLSITPGRREGGGLRTWFIVTLSAYSRKTRLSCSCALPGRQAERLELVAHARPRTKKRLPPPSSLGCSRVPRSHATPSSSRVPRPHAAPSRGLHRIRFGESVARLFFFLGRVADRWTPSCRVLTEPAFPLTSMAPCVGKSKWGH